MAGTYRMNPGIPLDAVHGREVRDYIPINLFHDEM